MIYDRLGSGISRGSIGVCTFTHRVFVVASIYQSFSLPDHVCIEGWYIEGRSCGRQILIARARSGDRVRALEVV